MKKFLITLISFIMLTIPSYAEWHSANQITLSWDAVTMLTDGQPIPEENTILYKAYIKEARTGAMEEVGPEIAELTCLITFTEEGDYYLGVSAIRIIPASGGIPEIRFESTISWTDEPANTAKNEVLGASYYIPTSNAGGLRIP